MHGGRARAAALVIAGIGIDLVDIARVDELLDAKGERALRRLFTADEVEYALRRALPAQHLAARLAAKEAAFKALAGNSLARGIGWREIEVDSWRARPDARAAWPCGGPSARSWGSRRSGCRLTHSATTAGAVVVLEAARSSNSV